MNTTKKEWKMENIKHTYNKKEPTFLGCICGLEYRRPFAFDIQDHIYSHRRAWNGAETDNRQTLLGAEGGAPFGEPTLPKF